jgi:membrane-associated protease RseP (regulator of RpoE activity)
MQTDLWERRLGWLSLVGIILFSGAALQSKFAAAEDAAATPPPATSSFVYDAPATDAPGDAPAEQKLLRTLQLFGVDQQSPLTTTSLFAGRQWGNGETGRYWIGVESREAQPELRAQIGLEEGQGLLVVHVAEDSPAAKAGIKKHDVIVSAGNTKLGHPQDLVKAVEGTEGKEMGLKLLRAGKEQVVQINPAERPKDPVQYIARPGMGMVISGAGRAVPLPDNVSISISRSGSKPAKISVGRGDEKWDITDQELNKLPDDLRPFVERMLGPVPMMMNLQGPPNNGTHQGTVHFWPQLRIEEQMEGRTPPGAPGLPGNANFAPPGNPPGAPMPPPTAAQRRTGNPGGDVSQDLIRRLEDVDRQLQRLQDEIRRMRENGPNSPHDPRGEFPSPARPRDN